MNDIKHPSRAAARRRVRNASSMSRRLHCKGTKSVIDFRAINQVALPVLPALLARWLPDGRCVGREYLALNPTRSDQRVGSFKIALDGPRIGAWSDFATGDRGGDVISLAAYLFNLSQYAAARRVADMLGIPHG